MLVSGSSPSANVPHPKLSRRLSGVKIAHEHAPSHTDIGTATRRKKSPLLLSVHFSPNLWTLSI
jgi:hypothetical protein